MTTKQNRNEKTGSPLRNKRFRIVKLEERIAPKKGGKGTHNCATAACTVGCY
jgi:hypothetical protein